MIMIIFLTMTHAAHHVELLLEFLICVINAELLKAVDFKCFKPLGKDKHVTWMNNLL